MTKNNSDHTMLTLTFSLFYFLNIATSTPLGDYRFIYATEGDLQFEKGRCSNYRWGLLFFGLLGRLFSGILSIWLPVYITFGVNMSGCLIFAIGEIIWGRTSQLGFVILCLGSLLILLCNLACIAWTDQYIVLTAAGYFALSVGFSLGHVKYVYAVYGSFYDKSNPEATTMYGLALFATVMFLLTVERHIVGLQQGSRFEKSAEEITYKDNVEVVTYAQFEDHFTAEIKSSPI